MAGSTRGVVVCPSISVQDRNFSVTTDLSAEDVRRYLLYWDRLAYAYANGVGKPNLDSLQDLTYLHTAGFLTLHDITVTTQDIGLPEVPPPVHLSQADQALFSFHAPTETNPTGQHLLGTPVYAWQDINYFAPHRAAKQLQDAGETVWSVAQTTSSYVFAGGRPKEALVLEATLYAALPVPSEDTPLDEILEFRRARQPELLRLRHAIDALRDKVLNAEDTHRALASARDELAIALDELQRSVRSNGMRAFFSTLQLYLNLSDSKLATTVIGALGAGGLGFPIEVGASIGLGVNTALTFAARSLQRPAPLPAELRDFVYLYGVERHWPSR